MEEGDDLNGGAEDEAHGLEEGQVGDVRGALRKPRGEGDVVAPGGVDSCSIQLIVH